jgi:hypothetical protein
MRSAARYSEDGSIKQTQKKSPKPWPPPPVSLKKLNDETAVLNFAEYYKYSQTLRQHEKEIQTSVRPALSVKDLKIKNLSRKVAKLTSGKETKSVVASRKLSGEFAGMFRGMMKSRNNLGGSNDELPLQIMANKLDFSVPLLQGILDEFRDFGYFDQDGQGTITLDAGRVMLRQLFGHDLTEAQITAMWQELDKDGSGEVDFLELVKYFLANNSDGKDADDDPGTPRRARPKKAIQRSDTRAGSAPLQRTRTAKV